MDLDVTSFAADVALVGVLYEVVVSNTLTYAWGTSASAPVLAGMISLINAARASQNLPSVGFINPTIYDNQVSVLRYRESSPIVIFFVIVWFYWLCV